MHLTAQSPEYEVDGFRLQYGIMLACGKVIMHLLPKVQNRR